MIFARLGKRKRGKKKERKGRNGKGKVDAYKHTGGGVIVTCLWMSSLDILTKPLRNLSYS